MIDSADRSRMTEYLIIKKDCKPGEGELLPTRTEATSTRFVV